MIGANHGRDHPPFLVSGMPVMTLFDADRINAMSQADMAAILAGPPEQAAGLVAAVAAAGLTEAQAVYGQMLLNGHGVARDLEAGFGWFRRAANAGHVMAMNMVGRCYEKGWGTAPDAAAATLWFAQAAKAGLDWGMYNYASSLIMGRGIAQDRAEALDWLRKAAALGHAKSMNFIGSFHEDGWVVPADAAEAQRWYRAAAEGGDFRGQFNLARLLAGNGQVAAALDWLHRSVADATPAFRANMKQFLAGSPVAELRAFGAGMTG